MSSHKATPAGKTVCSAHAITQMSILTIVPAIPLFSEPMDGISPFMFHLTSSPKNAQLAQVHLLLIYSIDSIILYS